jgi:predicted dehydrogenase
MASELCTLLPPQARVQMQACGAESELQAWVRSSPHRDRIEVVERPPACHPARPSVALVVNPAYQHRSTIEELLAGGYHVVAEKPLAFSRTESLRLIEAAGRRGLKLLCTNTYLFASYLDKLRRGWLAGRAISTLHIAWSDAADESRHGEVKRYDSTVPVFFDVLPHVAAIVLATCGPVTVRASELDVREGGSAVAATFECGPLTIHANLARNAAHRLRLARFAGSGGEVHLDFSTEPGRVSVDGGEASELDPAWTSQPRPVAAMLRSLTDLIERGTADERLGPAAALLANDLIAGVEAQYVDRQIEFLSRDVRSGPAYDYAAREAGALAERALPYLAEDSSLRRLAAATARPSAHAARTGDRAW